MWHFPHAAMGVLYIVTEYCNEIDYVVSAVWESKAVPPVLLINFSHTCMAVR